MPPVSQDPLYLFGKVKQDWAVSGCEITITGNNKCLNPIVHSCKPPPKKKTTDKRWINNTQFYFSCLYSRRQLIPHSAG